MSIQRIASMFALVAIATSLAAPAYAAHITVTAMGESYDLECSEILVDGEHINAWECGLMCSQIDNIDGWDCDFNIWGANVIIDGPPDSDLDALFKSGEIDWDAKSTPTRPSTISRR